MYQCIETIIMKVDVQVRNLIMKSFSLHNKLVFQHSYFS